MTRLSYIVLVAALTVAHGNEEHCQADTCEMRDETSLVQTSIAYHKHEKTEMHHVLAELQEVVKATPKGPLLLQELRHGVMQLPSHKSDNAMRAAARGQPQLRNLAKRNPRLKAMFEDLAKLKQIKKAVSQANPSLVNMLGGGHGQRQHGHQRSAVARGIDLRQKPGAPSLFASRTASSHNASATMGGSELVWLESWGCETSIGSIDFPKGQYPFSFPLFGSDCEGYPWVLTFGVAHNSAYIVKGEWDDEASQTKYKVLMAGWKGLQEVGVLEGNIYHAAFNFPDEALYYIQEEGEWPDYKYSLMRGDDKGIDVAAEIPDCMYPYYFKLVTGSSDMIWHCNKNWEKEGDKNKIMKYSLGAKEPEMVTDNEEYFGFVTAAGSTLFYSMWEDQGDDKWGNTVYKCELSSCSPEKIGTLPEGVWEFLVTPSGEMITTTWTSWTMSSSKGSEYWTSYNVTSYDITTGMGMPLFSIGGTQQLQLI